MGQEATKFSCCEHVLGDIIVRRIIKFHIFTWTNNVNKILNGKIGDEHFINDAIQRKALEYCTKFRAEKAALNKIKRL